MIKKSRDYKDLIVWQKAIDLVIKIYGLTNEFPKTEIYGLTSQIRRCAVSIPSNIAEGSKRGSNNEYRQFLLIAYSSGVELETQLLISERLNYCCQGEFANVRCLLEEIMRMLNKMTYIYTKN